MTRLNTQFSVKGISLLNSVMASSSSVQFKKFLFNQVDDIAGNVVSPTKQARGDSGKEPKLHRWQNGEKTLGETRLSRGAISPLARFQIRNVGGKMHTFQHTKLPVGGGNWQWVSHSFNWFVQNAESFSNKTPPSAVSRMCDTSAVILGSSIRSVRLKIF